MKLLSLRWLSSLHPHRPHYDFRSCSQETSRREVPENIIINPYLDRSIKGLSGPRGRPTSAPGSACWASKWGKEEGCPGVGGGGSRSDGLRTWVRVQLPPHSCAASVTSPHGLCVPALRMGVTVTVILRGWGL